MKKTTRKSFSRKAIIIIASVFLVISLTATGFAAWLISNGSDSKKDGNVTASNVSDAILEVKITNDSFEDITFGPQTDDNVGQVIYNHSEASDHESLSVTVNGTIGNYSMLNEMTFVVKCPDSVLKAAGYTWNASGTRTYDYDATKAFIALPDYAMDKDGNSLPIVENGVKTENKTQAKKLAASDFGTAQDNNNTFTFKVEFAWGALFEGYNPGRYLDDESDKKLSANTTNKDALLAIANEEAGSQKYSELNAYAKRDILTAMKKTIEGSEAKATYNILVKATAKN